MFCHILLPLQTCGVGHAGVHAGIQILHHHVLQVHGWQVHGFSFAGIGVHGNRVEISWKKSTILFSYFE